jgi:hypothetical protein
MGSPLVGGPIHVLVARVDLIPLRRQDIQCSTPEVSKILGPLERTTEATSRGWTSSFPDLITDLTLAKQRLEAQLRELEIDAPPVTARRGQATGGQGCAGSTRNWSVSSSIENSPDDFVIWHGRA